MWMMGAYNQHYMIFEQFAKNIIVPFGMIIIHTFAQPLKSSGLWTCHSADATSNSSIKMLRPALLMT